jgi:hypothetical protein
MAKTPELLPVLPQRRALLSLLGRWLRGRTWVDDSELHRMLAFLQHEQRAAPSQKGWADLGS